ncbi:hypothetical protein AAFM46_10910 [Arthrobacter sp. TMP15]|uniref:hypothetical protein n=1 Tax=Arthrobacter sp. TMP15 TaxID=3140789 RepID=UPI0031BA5B71
MSRGERVEAASKAMLWSETMGRSSLDEMADAGLQASDALLTNDAAVERVADTFALAMHGEGLTSISEYRAAQCRVLAHAAITALLGGDRMNPDCRDGKHRSCAGDGWDEAHDHVTECQCSCHTMPLSRGGFKGTDMTGLLPAHTCSRPSPLYPSGVIWQCLECKKTYRMESVRDRGISQSEWAPFEVTS